MVCVGPGGDDSRGHRKPRVGARRSPCPGRVAGAGTRAPCGLQPLGSVSVAALHLVSLPPGSPGPGRAVPPLLSPPGCHFYEPFHCNEQEAPCLGRNPAPVWGAPWHAWHCVGTSQRYLLACTGLGRSLPPFPRCGGRLEERARKAVTRCLTGRIPRKNTLWSRPTARDSSRHIGGPRPRPPPPGLAALAANRQEQ